MTHEQILAILADIKIFDRKFKLTPGLNYAGSATTSGWHLQVTYNEPDVDTGKIELQESRKWYIGDSMTESEIVDTAFAAVMRSYDHVVQEHFTYKGQRVYSPHFTIETRFAMAVVSQAARCPVCEGPHDDAKHHAVRVQERRKGRSEQQLVEEAVAGFEHWLHQGMFAQTDELLQCYKIDESSPAELLGILSITYHAKDKLKRRDAFLAKIEAKLKAVLGADRAEDLLRSRR